MAIKEMNLNDLQNIVGGAGDGTNCRVEFGAAPFGTFSSSSLTVPVGTVLTLNANTQNKEIRLILGGTQIDFIPDGGVGKLNDAEIYIFNSDNAVVGTLKNAGDSYTVEADIKVNLYSAGV